MSYPCPRCGRPTTGTPTEGGLRWALCWDCMEADTAAIRHEREAERRDASLDKRDA